MIRMQDVKKIIKKCPVCKKNLQSPMLSMYGCCEEENRHFMCYGYGLNRADVLVVCMRYGIYAINEADRFQRYHNGLWTNRVSTARFTDEDILALINVRQ